MLISGSGTNLAALMDAARDPAFGATIALVVSNRPDAGGLARAHSRGIPTRVIDHRHFNARADFDAALDEALRGAQIEFVCLAGFMRLLGTELVARWRDRLINIHPSLLPAFKGLNAQAQALAAGVRLSGCTVHFVRPEMDAGPIIVQAAVPVGAADTVESLSARIRAAEHRCYPLALHLIARRRVRIENERVVITDETVPPGLLLSPGDAR